MITIPPKEILSPRFADDAKFPYDDLMQGSSSIDESFAKYTVFLIQLLDRKNYIIMECPQKLNIPDF
ncbi:MAG: hypothetical protein QNJ58_26715 [Desulfobacterales bacterium]|nr:hypothetical protein [Desulfobacterales bacterium]